MIANEIRVLFSRTGPFSRKYPVNSLLSGGDGFASDCAHHHPHREVALAISAHSGGKGGIRGPPHRPFRQSRFHPYFSDVRGSTIVNSVNSPGALSTLMLPPCCFTMMSWLIDRPSPVPSPGGLVVKKGLNIFALTFCGMPLPLSRIQISTLSPRFFVVAVSVGSKPSPASSLRLVVA